MHSFSSFLSKLNNASKSHKKYVFSQKNSLSIEFLKLLVLQGFISSFVEITSKKLIKIVLKFNSEGTPLIKNIKILSTPSKLCFLSYSQLAKVQSNFGCLILSTNHGLSTAQDCLKFKTGGGVLCFIS
jgi:small subunit ribosomal protein S8